MVFRPWQVMASAIRIITINQDEEAVIRINSNRPVTLEFPNHLVSVYEQEGHMFYRVEKEEVDTQTQEHYEPIGDMEDTQSVDDMEDSQDFDDMIETQIEDYGEEGFTQVEPLEFHSPTPSPFRCDRRVSRYLSRLDMEDIQALQKDLFGH